MSQTHVEVPIGFTQPISRIDLNNDGIGYLEAYDFSRANISEESRIACISTVASVCYGNPKAKGSISLYNRLANESAGLPSSSFEFVPVLLDIDKVGDSNAFDHIDVDNGTPMHTWKYGEFVEDGKYILTNLRALVADVGDRASEFLNTEDECTIIAKYYKVFKAKIDVATRTQYIRHRVSWQELSRRYVSGKRAPFEFYISPKMINSSSVNILNDELDEIQYTDLISQCVSAYDEAIARGVKPEEARRALPQSMYTTIWSAWLPTQLDSFYTLRLDSHAQSEIRELAQAMKDVTPSKYLNLVVKV